MFNKNESSNLFKEVETIIGPSVKVEGDFVGQGNLVIEGIVKGSVKTDGSLRIGEKSHITASVSAAHALISGEVRGNVTVVGDLELTATAKIWGDIQASSLAIARGAFLQGNCVMQENAVRSMDENNQAVD